MANLLTSPGLYYLTGQTDPPLISTSKISLFSDDANKKVELTQKWNSLLEAGKNEGEILKELGQPKLDDVTAKRAKKIIKKLNKEAAVSS